MNYYVRVTARAWDSIADQIRYIAVNKQMPETAERVLDAIEAAIEGLSTFPHRCQVAAETELVGYLVRAQRVKKSYLILFTVDDQKQLVKVIGFRHASQLPRPDKLGE